MGALSERPNAINRLSLLIELQDILIRIRDLAQKQREEMLLIELVGGGKLIKEPLHV